MQAVIDLGTNTFHLMIASVDNSDVVIHEKKQIPVKIGTGGIHQSRITTESMQRALNALVTFRTVIDQYSVSQVKAFATAAIRDAQNGDDFIRQAKQLAGIDIQAITGEVEAQLIYEGVKHSLPTMNETYLIVDIGGGSVECILVKDNCAVWQQSFRAGASLLIHSFGITDPIDTKIELEIEDFFSNTFRDLLDAVAQYPPSYMVGSAGSFESLIDIAKVDCGYTSYPITKQAQEVDIEDAKSCIDMLVHSTTAQRELLKGLVLFRIEMIVPSMLLTRWLIQSCGISKLICSAYSLKEGMLFHQTG
jgi:exopolyphosphatase/guanosine-5'-triphosphate,3'-diphosphate pyrophosphatase